ncbi:MAG: ABC transporter permease [Alphaproteobacteria bacterium]|nr:ABC transporter permease [Alphaproteobacteria bacterium]
MHTLLTIARRELSGYFATPLAYVFLITFAASAGAMTFFVGGFFSRRQADLSTFFTFHPWLFLVLIPAIGMRLWAEERRTGTIEILMTMPVAIWEAVVGKFLAGWAFTALALVATLPMWMAVNYLGSPDNGVIFASYIASFLMAGALLALASCLSALTRNQVIAFVISIAACGLLMAGGVDMVISSLRPIAPAAVIDFLSSASFLTHFSTITNGVLDVRDSMFFISFILLCLFINVQIIDMKKGA